MNKNVKTVYRILRFLEESMNYNEFDAEQFKSEHPYFNISRSNWGALLEMLSDSGYVKGVRAERGVVGYCINIENPAITLKGLEYLAANPLMRQAAKKG